MPLPVTLRAVVDELEIGLDDWRSYINRRTGELASFGGEVRRRVEDDEDPPAGGWQLEQWRDCRRVLENPDFILLPSKFDIHEYSIMERFCLSRDERTRERLLDAIAGRGAFRRFKDLVHRKGIAEDWCLYRDAALKRIAADFLEARGIPFVDDEARPGPAPEAGQ